MSANETEDHDPATHAWRASEVAARLGISERTFKQMRALGVVDAAIGTGKSARYGEIHLDQARRLRKLMDANSVSMPAAAELLRSSTEPVLSKPGKKSNRRRAVDACIFGKIEDLGSGVFLVYDPRSSSKLQRQLLVELRRCVEIARGIRNLHTGKETRGPNSRIHRAR